MQKMNLLPLLGIDFEKTKTLFLILFESKLQKNDFFIKFFQLLHKCYNLNPVIELYCVFLWL